MDTLYHFFPNFKREIALTGKIYYGIYMTLAVSFFPESVLDSRDSKTLFIHFFSL